MGTRIFFCFLVALLSLALPVEAPEAPIKVSRLDEIPISYVSDVLVADYHEADGMRIWDAGDVVMRSYYLPSGDYEIDFILKSPPDTNSFDIGIDLSGYEVFFQPSLEAEIDGPGWVVNSTHAYNKVLDMGVERPIDVVDSYAVYTRGPAGLVKYAHIYRPLVTDVKGAEVWGSMNYSRGVLTVTVDQKYLDSAIYPVVVDPVIGKVDKGASNFYNKDNINTCQFNITENMLVYNITIYLNKGVGAANVTYGLYANDNEFGNPSHFLAETEELLNWAGDGWITLNFTEPIYYDMQTSVGYPNPVNETEISIAWWSSDNLRVYYDTGTYANQWQRDVFTYTFDVWPGRYFPDAGASRVVSCYLTYEPFPVESEEDDYFVLGLVIGTVSLLGLIGLSYHR